MHRNRCHLRKQFQFLTLNLPPPFVFSSTYPPPPSAPPGGSRHVYSLLRDSYSTCGVLSSIIACVLWHNSRAPLGNLAEGGDDAKELTASGATKPRRSIVILPRDAHKSAVHALVLSGATPCFLPPLRHPKSGVSLGIGTAALEEALKEHGDEVRQRIHGRGEGGEGAGGGEGGSC